MTQEYIKTQIADTETAGHILILFMSYGRQEQGCDRTSYHDCK